MNGIQASTIIELVVDNHAGVMSHITGLFARRGYNLEGIVCGPIGDGSTSRMFLLVGEDNRTVQICKQIGKLHDVREVKVREDFDHTLFRRLHEFTVGQ